MYSSFPGSLRTVEEQLEFLRTHVLVFDHPQTYWVQNHLQFNWISPSPQLDIVRPIDATVRPPPHLLRLANSAQPDVATSFSPILGADIARAFNFYLNSSNSPRNRDEEEPEEEPEPAGTQEIYRI